jgi:hypothetical protein
MIVGEVTLLPPKRDSFPIEGDQAVIADRGPTGARRELLRGNSQSSNDLRGIIRAGSAAIGLPARRKIAQDGQNYCQFLARRHSSG